MELTLKKTIELMNLIKENNNVEIVVDSYKGIPKFYIQEKLITMGGYK